MSDPQFIMSCTSLFPSLLPLEAGGLFLGASCRSGTVVGGVEGREALFGREKLAVSLLRPLLLFDYGLLTPSCQLGRWTQNTVPSSMVCSVSGLYCSEP